MLVDRDGGGPEIGHTEAGAAPSGFTDDAFDARYAEGQSAPLGSSGNSTTGGARAGPQRSRNSYMRARARRLAAAAQS
jgi:hypothetical protein